MSSSNMNVCMYMCILNINIYLDTISFLFYFSLLLLNLPLSFDLRIVNKSIHNCTSVNPLFPWEDVY